MQRHLDGVWWHQPRLPGHSVHPWPRRSARTLHDSGHQRAPGSGTPHTLDEPRPCNAAHPTTPPATLAAVSDTAQWIWRSGSSNTVDASQDTCHLEGKASGWGRCWLESQTPLPGRLGVVLCVSPQWHTTRSFGSSTHCSEQPL